MRGVPQRPGLGERGHVTITSTPPNITSNKQLSRLPRLVLGPRNIVGIFHPRGAPQSAGAGHVAAVVSGAIDADLLASVRENLPALRHRTM